MTTGPNLHRDLSTTNPGRTPQEGEVSRILNWRPGPEARDSYHAAEGSSKTGTQLGGSLHHLRSERQGVVHHSRSGWNPTQEAMKLFSLEAILCVSQQHSMKRSFFSYLNRVSSNSNICPEYHAHSHKPIWVLTLTVTPHGAS